MYIQGTWLSLLHVEAKDKYILQILETIIEIKNIFCTYNIICLPELNFHLTSYFTANESPVSVEQIFYNV
jgi:hypothetical protein